MEFRVGKFAQSKYITRSECKSNGSSYIYTLIWDSEFSYMISSLRNLAHLRAKFIYAVDLVNNFMEGKYSY
jgi:hypothetical protein